MRKLLFVILGLFITMTIQAQDSKFHALIFKLANNSEIAFILSEKPVITMSTYEVTVKGVVDTHFNRDEVVKFFFDYVTLSDPRLPNKIEDITKDEISFYYVDGENVRISGLKDNATVSVASLDGKIVSTQKSDGTESVTISLGNQPRGVYIISFGGRSVKIRK